MAGRRNLKGETAFFSACSDGDVKKVRRMLASNNKEINIPNREGDTPFFAAVKEGHFEIIQELLKQPHLEKYTKVNYTPLAMSTSFWHNTGDHRYKEVSDAIKTATLEAKSKTIPLKTIYDIQSKDSISITDAYRKLFGENPAIGFDKPTNHDDVIKYALAQCQQLLMSPQDCLPLLKKIDLAIREQWKLDHNGEEIPPLDENQFIFVEAEGLLWPKARGSFSFPKKHSVLQKVLLRILKSSHCSKWYGFVTEDEAVARLKQLDFFTENTLMPQGVMHGKSLHNIQRALLILAAEHHLIHLSHGVSMQDVLAALVDEKFKTEGRELLWGYLFDLVSLYEIKTTFSDPFRFHSFLMFICGECDALRSCLIDTFLSSIEEMAKMHNAKYTARKPWGPDDVWENWLSRVDPHRFSFSTEMSFLWQKSKKKIPGTIRLRGEHPDFYAVVPKSYKI